VPNVKAVELVDAGTLLVQGAPAVTVGVEPSTFRNFMPPATARSDQLWQYIAGGVLASSFEMARDRKLPLGAMLSLGPSGPAGPVGPVGPDQRWLGALVSIGLPGIDMVVSRALSATLHLVPNAEAIVSAPAADPVALQAAITRLVPGSTVELIRPEAQLGGSVGASLTRGEQSKVISAALSRVGLPYVWGATGPSAFDCSGLVRWSFAAAGIAMPRTAAEQARTGPRVPLNQVQPGDLLFWAYDANDPTFIDHVAMYLGGDMMVVAPETGQLVQVTQVPTDHLVGAIRVNVIR
jgi:peptidoglycan DL-endopeptidase CwlO